MADLSKVKIGDSYYTLKDAEGRTLITAAEGKITAEETRAKGIEAGLDTRVTNLEARGRFLSNYNVGTGLPTTYPDIPSTATSTYTYTFKSGDYYIVGSVPASGTKYMPSGSSITATKSGDEWTWEVGKAVTTATISVGDQFVFDGTNWVHIAAAKDVAWGTIVGTLSQQTDLKNALDLKEDKSALKAMAYAPKAKGSTTLDTIDSITMNDVTVAGNATVTHTATTYTIPDTQKADYTPSGAIKIDNAEQAAGNKVLKGGSISVTVKDASAATAVTDIEYESYTPAGTIAAKAEGGSFTALKSATFANVDASTTGAVQIEGTVSAPNVTVTAGAEKTFATGLTGGKVASFTEGAFTAASYDDGFLSAGAQASFTQGSKAALTDQTTASFAKKVLKPAVGSGDDAECLIFNWVADDTAAGTTGVFDNAVTDRGTFTANGDDSFTANTLQSLDSSKFHGGSKAADTFTANELQSVETGKVHDTPTAALASDPIFTGEYYVNNLASDTALKSVEFTGTAADVKFAGAKYLKQEIDAATFSGTEAALSFSGSKAEKLVPTAITYDKADAAAAYSTSVTPTVSELTKTAKTIEIVSDPYTPA